MSSYTIPGIVPNPYLPFQDYYIPKTISNTDGTQVVQFPSDGVVHHHFAIVYTDSDAVPKSSTINIAGEYGQGQTLTANALGPFDWKKVEDGGYYTFVQFNLDTPTNFNGNPVTIQDISGNDGTTFTLMIDGEEGKEDQTFRVFHGVPSSGPSPGSSPSRPLPATYACSSLTPKTTYTLPLDKTYTLTSLTLYVNMLQQIPNFENYVTINNVHADSSVYQGATSIPCAATLQLKFNRGVSLGTNTLISVDSAVVSAGVGFANDSSGLFFTSTVNAGLRDSQYPRPQGPVTSSCPNCYDQYCPIADMKTGNCATTQKETTDTNAVFYNKCTYGGNDYPCVSFADMDSTYGIYTQDPHRVLEASQAGTTTPQPSVNYYLPQSIAQNGIYENVYSPEGIPCQDPNCQTEMDQCQTYTADGSSFSPYCPKMTTPVITDCSALNGKFTRKVRCVFQDPPSCDVNGYGKYRNTCAMNSPLKEPVGSSYDICGFYTPPNPVRGSTPPTTCTGGPDDSMLTEGWTAGSCEGMSVYGLPDCTIKFTNTIANPKKGDYYWKSGQNVHNFIEPLGTVECTSNGGCSDQIKSITLSSEGWQS